MKYFQLSILTGALLISSGSFAQTKKHKPKHTAAKPNSAATVKQPLPVSIPKPTPSPNTPEQGTPKTKVKPPSL